MDEKNRVFHEETREAAPLNGRYFMLDIEGSYVKYPFITFKELVLKVKPDVDYSDIFTPEELKEINFDEEVVIEKESEPEETVKDMILSVDPNDLSTVSAYKEEMTETAGGGDGSEFYKIAKEHFDVTNFKDLKEAYNG